MDAGDLKKRTKTFGLDIIRLVDALPRTQTARVIGSQLLRCGLSVGANYRLACRAQSHAGFIAKIGISIEGADETGYWLELLSDAGLLPPEKLQPLMREADDLVAILTASAEIARENLYRRKPSRPVKPVR